MNKNNSFLKLVLFSFIGLCAMFSTSEAVNLTFDMKTVLHRSDGQSETGNVSPIHFADNGNNFGGFFYFTNVDASSDHVAQSWDEYVNSNGGDAPCPCPDKPEDPDELWSCPRDGVLYSCEDGHKIIYEPAPFQVEAGSVKYECKRQVRGFYYNSQRGERLWPLDEDTLSGWNMTGVSFTGGMYTLCTKAGYGEKLEACLNKSDGCTSAEIGELQVEYSDTHAYYGSITHEYQGEKWNLIMGVNYEEKNPWYEPAGNLKLSSTFQRFGNQFPVGFIYDFNGGLGFVGCKVLDRGVFSEIINELEKGNKTIEDVIIGTGNLVGNRNDIQNYNNFKGFLDCENVGTTADSLLRLIVDGLVGMGTNSNADSIANNTTSDKMQYFGSVNVNNAALINFTKQKAESLCRGKWVQYSSKCSDKVCCFNANGQPIDAGEYKGRTLIVKNGNVKVAPFTGNIDDYYDIFIDSGNLLIMEKDGYVDEKFVIGRNGFITDIDTDNFNTKVSDYYAGNDTVTEPYNGTGVAVASVIKGNFIVNGRVRNGESSNSKELKNKYFIYGKFTTKDSYDELSEIFKRKCGAGFGDDNNRCPDYDKNSPYKNAFLVVIDQNYNSPLFW